MADENQINHELRSKAEAKARKQKHSRPDLSMENAKMLMHELEVHQIELEMQNQELREVQHRLEDARDRYTDLFDFAPVGYLILNEKGLIQNINLTACTMMGTDRSQIKGKPFSGFMSSGESGTLFLMLREAFENGMINPLELQIKHSGSGTFTALIHGTVTESDHAAPVCRLSVQDVTELRKTEALQQRHLDLQKEKEKEYTQKYTQELEALVKKRTQDLSEALESEKGVNEMKSAFITIASHELRTPVTIIMSSITLIDRLKELGHYDKIDRHIDRIKSAVHNFTNILEDFLSLEKLEKGVVRVKKETFDVQEFVRSTIEEMEGMLKTDQHITYNHEGKIQVVQDTKMLRNIFSNLLANAIKYSDADIAVQTQITDTQLTASIGDHGIGIPEEDREHLFQRFFRAKNAKDFQGTGLGLSIVERHLDLLGGSISFETELGQGSTFTIELPSSV